MIIVNLNAIHTAYHFNFKKNNNMKRITLTSTIVASFDDGCVYKKRLSFEQFAALLPLVSANYCGHPTTSAALAALFPALPPTSKGFWSPYLMGSIWERTAICCRPAGGQRGGTTDAAFDADAFEYCIYVICSDAYGIKTAASEIEGLINANQD